MKIALFCPDSLPCPPIYGGAIELLIHQVAPYLSQLNHEVTVISIQNPDLASHESIQDVRYIRFSKDKYLEKVIRHIEYEQYDIIQLYNTPQWADPVKSSSPDSLLFLSLHNVILGHSVNDDISLQAVELLDGIITVSRFVANDIVKRFPSAANKITMLYTGEEASRYIPHYSLYGHFIAYQLKRKLGIPNEYLVALYVGRLQPKKGCHVLLEAMRNVIRLHPKAALVIAGSKWFGDRRESKYIYQLKNMAAGISEHIYFTNSIQVNSIPDYYTMSNLLVCPSQWEEPLARVQYEAMAAGLPIVTTNRGGNKELVLNGANGIVVDQYDQPEALAKAMNRLLADRKLRKRMGNQNRKLIMRTFNFKNYAKQISTLYESSRNTLKEANPLLYN